MSQKTNTPLLKVSGLTVEFKTEKGIARAVDNVTFTVNNGETLGIVGESGCGKSVTAMSMLQLVPIPPGRYVSGTIELEGKNLLSLQEKKMRKIRGNQISMIFQEPMTALNPVYTIGNQMIEVIRLHKGLNKREARKEAIRMLETVEIESPAKRIDQYPHELSGGMRQRVMIAMALSCGPRVLVADEPTTALDVTIQAQVMDEINRLQKQFDMGVILITHDLGVIAETCQRVLVMYCGNVVEEATTKELFAHPKHPYTQGLLQSIPRIREEKIGRLPTIKGLVPDLEHLPAGCRFADRCPRCFDRCLASNPPLETDAVTGRKVACYDPC